MCTAPSANSNLRLSRDIRQESLRRANETGLYLIGLTGGAAAHELFIADNSNNAVRSFDLLSARLEARDVYRAGISEWLSDVVYIAELDTLFVATGHKNDPNVSVRSFGRTNSGEWSERYRILLSSDGSGLRIRLRVLRDGTLFCGQIDTNGVHMCHVQSDHSIQNCTRLQLPSIHSGFDVELVDNEKFLAAAVERRSVALFHVNTESVAQLSLVPLAGAFYPLFIGNILLVGVSLDGSLSFHQAVLFLTFGGNLKFDSLLIARDALNRLRIRSWCYLNRTLFSWNYSSKQLLLYDLTEMLVLHARINQSLYSVHR